MEKWILMLLLTSSLACYSQKQTQKNDWEKDIEFLKTNLPKNHKNLFFQRDKVDFDTGIEKIISEQGNLTDFEIALKLQQLIASLGDSHTTLKWKSFITNEKIFPIRLYWFSDGIFIIKTTKENKELLGKRITGINGSPISTIVDSLSTLITVDNDAIIKNEIPKLLILAELLDFFKFSNNTQYAIEVETTNGIKTTHQIKPYVLNSEKLINIPADSVAYCWTNNRISFTEKFFEADNVYYIQYNQCVNVSRVVNKGKSQTISFNKFKKKILKAIKKKKPNKLVFDLRFNSGGSSYQGTKLIKKLAELKEINQKGKLFVIIGRRTFSSAIINTMDFIENTNAIIVGEKTGGKPNHYGELGYFELPSSGVRVYYSKKYFKRTNKDLKTIVPDIEIEMSFLNFKQGIDPIYEWIIKQ